MSGQQPRPNDEPGKPTPHLASTAHLTFDQLIDLCRKLTGREPTPEEIEEARAAWDEPD